MSVIPSLLLLIVLIGVNAFFAMSEIAIISANATKMKNLAENGNKRAALLLKIIDAPSDFLSTIQVGVTLSGFLSSAVAADKFTGMLTSHLTFLPIPTSVLNGIVLVVITLVLSYFTLIFGELVPKRIAMKDSDKMALRVVGIIWGVYRVCRPLIKLLSASTNLILRLFGIGSQNEEEKVTEEEILMMVESGGQAGTIRKDETEMIKNIFEFDDLRVSEVMTHRTDIVALEETASLEEFKELVREEHYSRIPVYADDLDNITGMVSLRDVLLCENPPETIKPFVKPLLYVPSTIRCSALLNQFKEKKTHLAVVVDEYGGTEGLVAVDDLLEAIVGDLDDGEGEPDDMVTLEPDGAYLLDADLNVEDADALFQQELFDGEDGDYETINGFVCGELDRIPEVGAEMTLGDGDYLLRVVEANSRQVLKVRVEKLEKPEEPETEQEEDTLEKKKKHREDDSQEL